MASKSSSTKIPSPNTQEKTTRIPSRRSGILRPLFNKLSGSGQKSPSVPKSKITKESKTNERRSNVPSPSSQSIKGHNSSDNSSALKSSLGNNLNAKNNLDTPSKVKDLKKPDTHENLLPNANLDSGSIRMISKPKTSLSDTQLSLKAPTYKREPNGKWILDEKYQGPETVCISKPKPLSSYKGSSPEENSSKTNPSDNNFSTYASYKRHLSYQKKSFSPKDLNMNTKEKNSGKLPTSIQYSPSSSNISKVKRQTNEVASTGTVFHCGTEKDKVKKNELLEGSKNLSLQKQSSPVSKVSESLGVLSPPSEDNREFLIDDEISDQPGLTFYNDLLYDDADVELLQLALSELHAPSLSKVTKNSNTIEGCSSQKGLADGRDGLDLQPVIDSDNLMTNSGKVIDSIPENTVSKSSKSLCRRSSGIVPSLTDKKESLQRTLSAPLRPPRRMTVCEADDGGLKLDSSSYRLLCQDLNGIKTLLLRLKSVLQEVETIYPFDQLNPNNIFYHTLAQNDFPSNLLSTSIYAEKKTHDISTILEENADLRRQIVLFHEQLEEKDHAINLLQQQMTKYLSIHPTCKHETPSSNAATQTERRHSLSGSLSSSSFSDDSAETLISSQVYLKKTLKRQSAICCQHNSNNCNPCSMLKKF